MTLIFGETANGARLRRMQEEAVQATAAEEEHHRFRVEPNPSGGFYVVEHVEKGPAAPFGPYDIPRGWTYPDRALAEAALPLVAAGNWYPGPEEVR